MYAKIFHVSTKDLRICAKNPTNDYYNPIVDVLRPAQKLQVWNTYIPAITLTRFTAFSNRVHYCQEGNDLESYPAGVFVFFGGRFTI